MAVSVDTLSVAAFTALGTIVGYLGTEVASDSIFNRLLWPSRFYNTKSLASFVGIGLLMPMGGPIHKAAVEALDQFVLAGLLQGYCRGDMLGTAFYSDTGHRYVERLSDGSKGEEKSARNAFWITVLERICWKPRVDHALPKDDEAAERTVYQVRAQRPVFVLKLSRPSSSAGDSNAPIVTGDTGPLAFRYLAGVMVSEVVTLAVGIVTAVVWKSLFSIWYLFPLVLKLVALLCCTRRNATVQAEADSKLCLAENDRQVVYEVVDISKGFFLIEGPYQLVFPFFHHYGHPVRNRRGLLGDRVREVISMLTVMAFIMVYPGALIAFVFAPVAVQWVWVGYQLYAMLAMHVYRFYGGKYIGTTQEWVAQALSRRRRLCVFDATGHGVVAELESSTVSTVAEGSQEVERLVCRVLDHAEHNGTGGEGSSS
ncbi:hypothetical protein BDV28DRAFT_156539 [Aspergillus coremiiformis]|uniref:Uncharacterized protein n=1 Tax=Aspergillus coremiiformis TaxID=138285 RepID=A0A5N6Z8N9_9EURO|nr:hypothetical protein BDV28DRAFT_156539 [Aspergillus coremiiformis]